jgi:hypothetical protein
MNGFQTLAFYGLMANLLTLPLIGTPTASASPISCQGLYRDPKVVGLVEARLLTEKASFEETQKITARMVDELGAPGSKGPKISAELIKTIEASVQKYNHTMFDVVTPESIDATREIIKALQGSPEFGVLSPSQIEDLAVALTRGNRNLRIPMFGTKHMLYHALYDMNLNQSPALLSQLIALQTWGNISKSQFQKIQTLQGFKSQGLKGLESRQDLQRLFEEKQAEFKQASTVPSDLVESVVALAQEYNHSQQSLGMSAGQASAVEKFRKLSVQHPFLKGLSESQKFQLMFEFSTADTPELATELLSRFSDNPIAQKKQAQLTQLAKAVEYFQKNPSVEEWLEKLKP